MRCSGELYFKYEGDNDVIKVHSLILRKEGENSVLAFDITTTWACTGNFRRSGICHEKDGTYVSGFAPSKHMETGKEGCPCRLFFTLRQIDDEFVSVEGGWEESGFNYEFEGDLEVS